MQVTVNTTTVTSKVILMHPHNVNDHHAVYVLCNEPRNANFPKRLSAATAIKVISSAMLNILIYDMISTK